MREQTRVIELAGRTFNVPLMYVDAALEPGLKQDGLLLEVIWPDMRSIYELKDKAEYTRIWKEEKRRGWILLEPAANRPSLDAQVNAMQSSMMKWETMGSSDGLEKRLWYRGTPDHPKLQHEIFIERDPSGRIMNYIDCDSSERGPVPQCGHKFIDGGLIYENNYNKARFLSEWWEQQQRAIEFINSLEVASDSESKLKGE